MTRTCNCFADESTPGYEGHLPTCNLHYPSGCAGIMPDDSTGEVVFRQATLAELFPAPAPDAPAERERIIPATLDDMNEWEYEASENPHPNGVVQSARLLRVIAAYRALAAHPGDPDA